MLVVICDSLEHQNNLHVSHISPCKQKKYNKEEV